MFDNPAYGILEQLIDTHIYKKNIKIKDATKITQKQHQQQKWWKIQKQQQQAGSELIVDMDEVIIDRTQNLSVYTSCLFCEVE